MKKIMFNDRFELTQAVLEGRKTMTRRLVPQKVINNSKVYAQLGQRGGNINDARIEYIVHQSPYKIGEVVAIAQCYYNVYGYETCISERGEKDAGIFNKMFVRAESMPHHIKITNIRVEHLQDISDEDCLKEGIYIDKEGGQSIGYPLAVPFYCTFRGAINRDGKQLYWSTPKDAFATLIDKVSGKGTWESNPYVWVYEFELVDEMV